MSTIVVLAVLTRTLSDDDFGVVALALVFVSLTQVLAEQGLAQALIQRAQISAEMVSAAFWTTVVTGTGMTAVMALGGVAAHRISNAHVGLLVAALSPVVLFGSLASVPVALLRRDFQFKRLAIRQILASIVGGAVGIALALADTAEWSLVGRTLAQSAVSVTMVWLAVDFRGVGRPMLKGAKGLLIFGWSVLGTQLAHVASRRADDVVIGARLGSSSLGLYSVAYRLVDVILEVFTTVAHTVGASGMARIRAADSRRYRRLILESCAITLSGATFTLGIIAIYADEVVGVVFGEHFQAAGGLLRLLALAGIGRAVISTANMLLIADGVPALGFRIAMAAAVAQVPAFVLAAVIGGSEAVAGVHLVMNVAVVAPVLLVVVFRRASMNLRTTGPALIRAVIIPAVVLLLASPPAIVMEDQTPSTRLAAGGMSVVAAVAIVLLSARVRTIDQAMVTMAGVSSLRRASGVSAEPSASSDSIPEGL